MIGRCNNCNLLVVSINNTCPKCDPTNLYPLIVSEIKEEPKIDIKDIGRKAWEKLHSMRSPTEEKIQQWLITDVPKYGCDCASFAREWIKNNPPKFNEEFFKWTWEFHNAVDVKIGDELMTFEEALAKWCSNN